jgi:hypothetical protein
MKIAQLEQLKIQKEQSRQALGNLRKEKRRTEKERKEKENNKIINVKQRQMCCIKST